MSKDPKGEVNWDDLDDTSSEDDGDESGSGSESNEEEHHPHEESKKHEHHHGGKHGHHYEEKQGNWKHSHNKYGDDRRGKQNRNYNNRNPEGNFEKYYRNDPDFFVKVIKLESPPHELCIKLRKRDYNTPDLSKNDIFERLKPFGVEDLEYIALAEDVQKVTAFINSDSEKAAKVYAALYDNAYKEFNGFSVNIYYERDIEVLEKHADIAADEYYKQQKENETKSYGKKYNKGYEQRPYEHHKEFKKHSEETTSVKNEGAQKSLAGFNTGGGPLKYFNKKKIESEGQTSEDPKLESNDTSSVDVQNNVKDDKEFQNDEKKVEKIEKEEIVEKFEKVGKTETLVDNKIEIKAEAKLTEKVEQKTEDKQQKSKDKIKEVPLVRRDTDNEFEITIGQDKKKSDPDVLVNKVDVNNLEENKDIKDKAKEEVVLKPRHHDDGKQLSRKPWTNKYRNNIKTIEKHIQSNKNEEQNFDTRSTKYNDKTDGRYFDKYSEHGGYKKGYNKYGGRNNYGGYNNKFNDYRTQYDQYSQYSENYDAKSTQSNRNTFRSNYKQTQDNIDDTGYYQDSTEEKKTYNNESGYEKQSNQSYRGQKKYGYNEERKGGRGGYKKDYGQKNKPKTSNRFF